MTDVDLDALVRSLSHGQLVQLRALIALQLDTASDKIDQVQLFYDTLKGQAWAKGVVLLPWGGFKRTNLYAGFKRKAEETIEYLEHHLRPAGSTARVERAKAYTEVSKMLLRWAEQMPFPVGPNTIVNNVHRVPSIVESRFPGYAADGLLRIALLGEQL